MENSPSPPRNKSILIYWLHHTHKVGKHRLRDHFGCTHKFVADAVSAVRMPRVMENPVDVSEYHELHFAAAKNPPTRDAYYSTSVAMQIVAARSLGYATPVLSVHFSVPMQSIRSLLGQAKHPNHYAYNADPDKYVTPALRGYLDNLEERRKIGALKDMINAVN